MFGLTSNRFDLFLHRPNPSSYLSIHPSICYLSIHPSSGHPSIHPVLWVSGLTRQVSGSLDLPDSSLGLWTYQTGLWVSGLTRQVSRCCGRSKEISGGQTDSSDVDALLPLVPVLHVYHDLPTTTQPCSAGLFKDPQCTTRCEGLDQSTSRTL